jgi:hypothetical protein
LAGKLEAMAADMPAGIVQGLRSHLKEFTLNMNVIYASGEKYSYVDYSPEGDVAVYFGQDVFDGVRFNDLALGDLLASAVTFMDLQTRYRTLNEEALTNENARYKLEVLKALLNYKTRSRQLQLRSQELDSATHGMSSIPSWVLFLNVMNDANPHLVLDNYLYMLGKRLRGSDNQQASILQGLIERVEQADVSQMVSFAHLRNIIKEFLLDGIARVPVADQVMTKDRYDHLDDTDAVRQFRKTLIGTQDFAAFYKTLTDLIQYMLPLDPAAMRDEINPLLHARMHEMNAAEREERLRDLLSEMLTRRLGHEAFHALENHMIGMRGEENIPHFTVKASERTGESIDSATELFPFPNDPGKDDTNSFQLNSGFDPSPAWKPLIVALSGAFAGRLIFDTGAGWVALAATLIAWILKPHWFIFNLASAKENDSIPQGFSFDGLNQLLTFTLKLLSRMTIRFKRAIFLRSSVVDRAA